MINRMEQQASQGLDRRALLARGGAVAAGVLGVTAVGAATASPASAVDAGLVYTPITPYRSYDSRFDAGAPTGIHQWDVFVLQLSTDAANVQKLPSSAGAVTFNLTITGTTGTFGYLGVVPGGTSEAEMIEVSNINWVSPGLTLANGGTTKLGTESASDPDQLILQSVLVYCDGAADASTHFIIDVTGYFA